MRDFSKLALTKHMPSPAASTRRPERITSLDGLRGAAALVVVLFHYICMLHPTLTPELSKQVHWLIDTPIHILWNGVFSVAVFFVLSGFVMAAAADRRGGSLIANSMTRYLRLALPATLSCLLAWGWLTAFPSSARDLKSTLVAPSKWLEYTYQDPILPIWYAGADGMLGNFIRGYSQFNNVLWTMQIELFGSLGIFLLYAFTQGRARLLSLIAVAVVILLWLPGSYAGFLLGAALYEAHRRDFLKSPPALLPIIALVAAIIVGGMGDGAPLRLELPDVPQAWSLGKSRGMVGIIAAALLIYATLTLPALARLFSRPALLFLGRISFGLYLVHVPLLYTIFAEFYLQGVPEVVLGPTYVVGALLLAWIFTLAADEPLLRMITTLRTRMTLLRWFGIDGRPRAPRSVHAGRTASKSLNQSDVV